MRHCKNRPKAIQRVGRQLNFSLDAKQLLMIAIGIYLLGSPLIWLVDVAIFGAVAAKTTVKWMLISIYYQN